MAEHKRDYYEVLGLAKSASDAEIKKAFRKLAKENHPDLHPGDTAAETRFKEVNEAYEVLSDPDKKAKYDQFGHAGVDPNFGGGGGYGDGFGGMDFDLGDIFNSFFGGGFGGETSRGRNTPRKGADIRVSTAISFEEAAFGCEKEVSVSVVASCDACTGTGAAEGTTPEVCENCRGTGSVKVQQRTAFGVMSSVTACNRCGGTGKIIHQPCAKCKGKGKVRKQKKVGVKIPAGIDDGQTISIRGRGDAGTNGGPAGDLLVTVSVRSHAVFERKGSAVLVQLHISVIQAILGAEVEVPTLDGKVKYTIPEGTQSGTTFRLKGKGIPYLNANGRGDEYCTVIVDIPKSLNAEQKELLMKFGESLGEKHMGEAAGRSGFFDKGKKRKKK